MSECLSESQVLLARGFCTGCLLPPLLVSSESRLARVKLVLAAGQAGHSDRGPPFATSTLQAADKERMAGGSVMGHGHPLQSGYLCRCAVGAAAAPSSREEGCRCPVEWGHAVHPMSLQPALSGSGTNGVCKVYAH